MTALMDPDALLAVLGDVTVLDVRWRLGQTDGRAQYLAGHVPGAAYVDLERDLADPPGHPVGVGGRHPLPDPDRFAAAMRRVGVRGDRPVVVYDDWAGMAATRAWWLLTFHGHPDVRLLDGGWSWWLRHGAGVEQGELPGDAGDFRADPGHLAVVDADGAARVARDGVLLDARAARAVPWRDRAGRSGRGSRARRGEPPHLGEPRRGTVPAPARSWRRPTRSWTGRRRSRRTADRG